MVLKGVSWVNNTKIRSYGLERSQLGTQYYKNHGFGSKNEVLKNQLILNSKVTQNLEKPWFLAKNHSFHENHGFWPVSPHPQPSKSVVFNQQLVFMKTMDFDQLVPPTTLKIHGFQLQNPSKPACKIMSFCPLIK